MRTSFVNGRERVYVCVGDLFPRDQNHLGGSFFFHIFFFFFFSLKDIPKVRTQRMQVRAREHGTPAPPPGAARSKSVKLDGGLSKVIMSKVPFSQDEH